MHDRLHHDRGYFDEMYAETLDPWGFETSWYERRKFALTVAALPRTRYRRAQEPGCSSGSLTALLGARCDELVAYDFVPAVVAAATERFTDHPGIEVVEAEFPTFVPDGTGDLVVWSEVAYYLTDTGFELAVANLEHWLEVGGHLMSVHYTGATDYPRTGRDVATSVDAVDSLHRIITLVDEQFELAVWERIDDAAITRSR
jgi:trans-aconitate methyltransferase